MRQQVVRYSLSSQSRYQQVVVGIRRQQQVVVGTVLVVKHRYSMQQYDVVVRSSMQQYVVVGTGSSRQQYVVVGSSTQFFLIPVVSLPTSTTYSTVDTKSTIRTYVVQYVHSQQREKTEFNAGRQCKRYPLESGSVCLPCILAYVPYTPNSHCMLLRVQGDGVGVLILLRPEGDLEKE